MRTTLFSDGFHSDTLTTYEDPLLRIKVEDNGISWRMIAYCGKKQIDSVDLERVRTSYMEKIIANTQGIDISIDMTFQGHVSSTRMLQEYLAEILEIVKGLDYVYGPDNPANWDTKEGFEKYQSSKS